MSPVHHHGLLKTGVLPSRRLFFFLGRKEGLKGALSPEHLSKTEVAVKEFTAQADEINRQWAFTKKYKG